MSIINNVLKDLESRNSQFTPIDIASVDSMTMDNSSGSRVPIMWLTGFLLVVVSGYWYYQYQYLPSFSTKPVAMVKTAPEIIPQPPVKSVVEVVKVAEPKSNQIVGLQISETASDVSLQFAMREKAVSFLKERAEDSFVYHIRDVESKIDAPRISGNRWIEKLSIKSRQDGVDVVLKTVVGVLVNTDQVQKEGETIWTIRLEKRPDPIVVASLETVAVEQKPEISHEVEKNHVVKEPEPADIVVEAKTPEVKVEIKSSSQTLSEIGQLNKASELAKNGQWKGAETLLLSMIDGPQDLSVRKQLLGIYSQPGYSEKYAEFGRVSSNRYPQQSLFKTEYARSLFQNQSYNEVIGLLLSVSQPDSKQQALIAASYQRIDQHDKAIEHYYHSLKLNKGEARNWIGLGISLEHEAKLEKALQSYQTAARLGNINARLKQFVEQRSRLLKKVMN